MVVPSVDRIIQNDSTSSRKMFASRITKGAIGGKVVPIRIYPKTRPQNLEKYLYEYQGNIIAHLSGIYGTAPDSWTTIDNRYTFTKSPSSPDLPWESNKLKLRGENIGVYTYVHEEDMISTEMTIEVVIGNYHSNKIYKHGIAAAFDTDTNASVSRLKTSKGLSVTSDGYLRAAYAIHNRPYNIDYPNSYISEIKDFMTIAITNGNLTGTKISYVINGTLTPSTENIYDVLNGEKTPMIFCVGGFEVDEGNNDLDYKFGLIADIYAVRFHYGITPVEQLRANYLLDQKIYGEYN